MNNIFNTNKPVAHNGRNGFDLSFSSVFCMRPAICRPVFRLDTVPNSSYKIDCGDIVRTSSLQQAAFLRGKQELDFFFIPYSQLYSRSNDIIFSRGDEHSVSLADLNSSTFPKYPLAWLVFHAALPYAFMRYCHLIGVRTVKDIIGWIQTPNRDTPCSDFIVGYFFNGDTTRVFSSMANTLLGMCTYNQTALNSGPKKTAEFAEFVGYDVLALIDSCGYGSYFQQLKILFDSALKSFVDNPNFNPSDPETRYAVAHSLYNSVVNFIGYIDTSFDATDPSQVSKWVNLIPLFAYQKIWRDVYRDTVNDDDDLYLYASSMDYDIYGLACHEYFIDDITLWYEPLLTFLRPRQRQYLKDLSSGLYTSTQFGEHASLDDALNMPGSSENVGSNDPTSAVSIQYALALQRYRQMLLRSGNRTKDLLMAEFGVKSHYVDDHYVKHIGSFDGALELNKVAATSESGSYSVGDLAGNIFSGLSGNQIDFTCNDHGIIIGIMSFFPDSMHNAFGLNPFNIKFGNMDFYHEQFENLGLQPVSSDVFSVLNLASDGGSVGAATTLGFSARYNEYKQNIDQVHDNFVTSPIVPSAGKLLTPIDGTKSNFVVVKPVQQTLSLTKLRSYILPSCMDTIFTTLDDGDPDFAHFDVCIQFNVSAVLPMSTLGLI